MQTNIMMLQTENKGKEQLQTTTLPEEKKAEGGSSERNLRGVEASNIRGRSRLASSP